MITLETNIVAAQQLKQPWLAPASALNVKNPVKPTPEGLKAAEELFQQNCVICHGKTGASNEPAAGSLPQKPANFTDVLEDDHRARTHAVLAEPAIGDPALDAGKLSARTYQESAIQIFRDRHWETRG